MLIDELKEIYNDTNHKPLEGMCNISFRTFLQANYSVEAIKEFFPSISSTWEFGE